MRYIDKLLAFIDLLAECECGEEGTCVVCGRYRAFGMDDTRICEVCRGGGGVEALV